MQYNWKAIRLILILSAGLGWFIDQLLKFNNYTFIISWLLPVIMWLIYHDYLYTSNKVKPKYSKWRHKLFTFIVFLFIARSLFGIMALMLGIRLFDIKNDNNFFLAVSTTSIIISIIGDKVLHYLFKSIGLADALDNKENFFSQNDIKMFIYLVYFILILVTNYGIKSETTQLWINTFATYVAFERFWKFWQDQNKKVQL